MPLLDIHDLHLEFGARRGTATILTGLSLSVAAGETLALVGESGSGKTVTALSIARLLPTPPARYPRGQILLDGRDTLTLTPRELRSMRGGVVSYVFQEPGASLNPVLRIGAQLREAIRLHRPDTPGEVEAIRLLRLAGIPDPESRLRNYPHELSGGMQQRVMIAMAVASRPKLLVADEPTTALDVTIQAQILELLGELKKELGMAMLLITHNLGVVAELADRVAVMYGGQVVETGPTTQVLREPLHPYTRALIESIPQLGGRARRLRAIPGSVPAPEAFPSGCRFSNRCIQAVSECSTKPPSLLEARAGHLVRCPFWAKPSPELETGGETGSP